MTYDLAQFPLPRLHQLLRGEAQETGQDAHCIAHTLGVLHGVICERPWTSFYLLQHTMPSRGL